MFKKRSKARNIRQPLSIHSHEEGNTILREALTGKKPGDATNEFEKVNTPKSTTEANQEEEDQIENAISDIQLEEPDQRNDGESEPVLYKTVDTKSSEITGILSLEEIERIKKKRAELGRINQEHDEYLDYIPLNDETADKTKEGASGVNARIYDVDYNNDDMEVEYNSDLEDGTIETSSIKRQKIPVNDLGERGVGEGLKKLQKGDVRADISIVEQINSEDDIMSEWEYSRIMGSGINIDTNYFASKVPKIQPTHKPKIQKSEVVNIFEATAQSSDKDEDMAEDDNINGYGYGGSGSGDANASLGKLAELGDPEELSKLIDDSLATQESKIQNYTEELEIVNNEIDEIDYNIESVEKDIEKAREYLEYFENLQAQIQQDDLIENY
ncbi:hypothetical protein AX774_g1441 [Zancudomyces culisetae]|uniref:Uncharacterized protein n=1 Tax=Zancudomyces culisetae TaxID=1213189 RepID=A0A1R1PVU2_ZANCU|nr:hypothetical protein AX774_g1441 [Zancudomyces culisetae]|eukprot:OMH85022.1 hypothetical protein AX774_g1441 [Zancudomyces culisetae]